MARRVRFVCHARALVAAFLTFGPLLALHAETTAGGYSRRVWQTQDGLPQDTINALVQSKDGYLWIGTGGGLARFDGFQFSIFDRENTPALHEESIYSLYSSRDGTLWIGTEGGGLVRHRAGTFQRFSASEGLTNGFVRVIHEDSRGRLWVGTDRGLFRFDDDRLTRVDNQGDIPGISVHAIYEDRRGRLWVGGSGFIVLSDGAVAVYRSSRSLADDSVRAIAESDNGTVWIATVGGLHRVEGENPAAVFPSSPILEHNTTFLFRSKDGDLWAGTYGQGLFRYRGREATPYLAPALLPDNHIFALLEDSEGNIWVGTQNGLLRLSRSVVSTISTGQPGAPESVKTIYEDRDGSIWMTTLSGFLYRLEGSRPVLAVLPGVAPRYRVRNVFRDSSGTLWIGTGGEGVLRVSSAGVDRYTIKQGLINDFVRAFCESRDGSIWIGTDSGLSRWHGGSFQNFHTAQGLAYGSARALLEDRAGDLWVGTDGGVSRFHAGVMAEDSRLAAVDGEKIWAIHEDPSGGIWFGTRGAGVFLLQDGNLTNFTTKHGLASNNIHQILEDRRGNLWLSGPSGVSAVSREDLKKSSRDPSYRPAVSLYGTSEGMETNQTNGGVQPAGAITGSGEIWFPTTRGAVRIAPAQNAHSSVPPVLIEQVFADGEESPLGDTIEVGPGEGRLEVHYTAVRLRSSDRIRFRYMLEGFETKWTEAGGRRAAYYTNLPAGSYRFRVAAYDADDPRYPSEAAVGVRLLPRFHEKPWFIALCVAVLAAAGLVGYRLHVRQIHVRFAAVLAERNRLAREMHDTLIQGCVGVSTLLDAAVSLQLSAPEMTRELLEQAQTQVRTSVDEARRAVWNLRHENSQGGGLVSALERLAQQVQLASGVPVDCQTVGKPVALDAGVEHDLVMIAKEAVLNAVHHGHPQKVVLTSSFDPGQLKVRVTDDGCGFDPSLEAEKPGEHYGMVGMSERAKLIGGTFKLESTPGKGTQVSLAVPLRSSVRA